MSLGERDPHTGIHTTGHEWAGITELDTPIPRTVIFFYALTFLIALAMWVLLPAWPLITTYTKGVLGYSQRAELENQLAEAAQQKATWSDRIAGAGLEAIATDPELRAIALRGAETLFRDNCAVCHGQGGKGGPGFPNLADGAWLWGGALDEIHETLRVGINAAHEETRTAQMLAFGRDGILEREDIALLNTYVRSLSGLEEIDPARLEDAATLFAENCASCHGEQARGDIELGAPNLTDEFWIYGGDRSAIYQTIYGGRTGQMPHWGDRLSPVQLKILALYVHSLGGP
jgi:cytochrome c oxidase cbb3-type subunit 3